MKKSLLLLASMLMSAASFAQWTEPAAPAFVPMAEDGETINYLYNIEAKGFFLGANDWNTRASVSKTKGYKVKMIMKETCNEYGETHTHWSIVDSVETQKEWKATFAASWEGIWVDNNEGANFDQWVVIPQGDNIYKIYNCGISQGKTSMTLGISEIFDGKKGNTRLWLFDPSLNYTYETEDGEETEAPRMQGEYYDKWAFVSPAEYEAYIPKVTQYNAAMQLKDAIDEAKEATPQANYSAAEAIYNKFNAATVEELDSARTILIPQAIADYKKTLASADNPADFTELLGSSDFESGTSGWLFTTNAQNKGTATNRCSQTDYPGTSMTGTFLENWNPDQFSGKIYTELTNLPAGVYHLEMDAFTNGGSDTYVYLNGFKTNQGGKTSDDRIVPLGNGNDIPAKFGVFGYINDGETLEIGLNVETVSANWIGIDNVKITYYGAELDAYKLWYQQERTSIIETMDALVTPETKYDKTQKEVFNAALAKGDNASAKEEIADAVVALKAASEATIASIDAYKELKALVKEYQNDDTEYDENGAIGYFYDLINAEDVADGSDAVDELKDLLGEKMNIEVSPIEIFEECTYSTDYIKTYIPALRELHDVCASMSLGSGTDITSMLQDPLFTDPNGKGWTRVKGGITWTGGLIPSEENSKGFPVAESYHSVFDFYQEVTVPDGIYSLALNGFCRLDDGETEVAAEIYMNDYATKFKAITEDQVPEEEAVDGINVYLSNGNTSAALTSNPVFAGCKRQSPNDATDSQGEIGYYPNGMEGASVAFSAGRFEAKVYGIVEGGKIKLGARCSSEHQWVLWSNFKLVYEGESEEAMEALAASFLETSKGYLENNQDYMSSPAIEALNNAINAVEGALESGEGLSAAIKAMNAEVENAKANVAALAAFVEAKDAMDNDANNYAGTASQEAVDAYDNLSNVEGAEMTTEELKEYTEKFKECSAALKIPTEPASDEHPVDFTQVIVNNDFEANAAGQQATGWTLVKGEGATGNYQVQNGFTETGAVSMEFWSNTNGSGTQFDFYQEIAGLPAGTYELTANAANSYNGQAAGPGEGAAYIYAAAGQNGKLAYTDNGMITPQEAPCNGADQRFTSYSVIFTVAEGDVVRIGAMNVGELPARWVMVDDFTLTYYGANSSKAPSAGHETVIKDAQTTAAPAGIYSISGAKLNSMKKGINIVKGADGSVRKIFVK